MAILKKTLILAALPLLLTGCYEDYYPRIDTDPVLCINSLITAGCPIEVKVSHTWLYTDEDGRKDHSVPDAVIEIYANDILVDTGYLPNEGDRIRIHASSLKYGEAEAEVTVPVATEISGIDYTINPDNTWIKYTESWGLDARLQFDIRVFMDLVDPKETSDFHRLTYETYDESGIMTEDDYSEDWQPYGRYASNAYLSDGHFEALDPVFYELSDAFEEVLNGGGSTMFFSDRLYNGKAKTLAFGFSSCFFTISGWKGDMEELESGWNLKLYSISESYYNWLVYSQQYSGVIFGDFGDFGMADPIWGYSNVSTGAGVVAAQSSISVKIDICPFLKQTLESGLKPQSLNPKPLNP